MTNLGLQALMAAEVASVSEATRLSFFPTICQALLAGKPQTVEVMVAFGRACRF